MNLQYRTEGFVFKKEDRFEADRIFSVFTKDLGRIDVLGKAIRKIASKLRGGIDIFSLSEIEFIQGKNRKTLIDAVYINKFSDLAKNPPKLLLAAKISEVFNNFIKGQEKDEGIFNLLLDTFGKLNDYQLSAANFNLFYYYFFWNFISTLGYGPEIQICPVCQKKLEASNLYFSNKEGGVICKNCAAVKKETLKIKSDAVKILRLIFKKDWDILSKIKAEESVKKSLKEISDNYCKYLLLSNSFK